MKARLIISFVFVGFVLFGIVNSSGVLDGVINGISNDSDYYQEDDLPIKCKGLLGKCYSGVISKIVDGDTIHLENGDSIRLTLVDSPEINTKEGTEAKEYLEKICPVGSTVIVDEDDGQLQGSYGRVIGLVYCEKIMEPISINALVLGDKHGTIYKKFCETSEFGEEYWAVHHGC